jgi:hypothetical protein
MAATTLADWKDWKEVAEEIAEANEQMFHTFSASALDLAEANCELNRQLNAISNVLARLILNPSDKQNLADAAVALYNVRRGGMHKLKAAWDTAVRCGSQVEIAVRTDGENSDKNYGLRGPCQQPDWESGSHRWAEDLATCGPSFVSGRASAQDFSALSKSSGL